MMKMRKAQVSCSACKRKTIVNIPLVNDIVIVTRCPHCRGKGLLISDLFISLCEDAGTFEVEETFRALGERVAEVIAEIRHKYPTGECLISDKEAKDFSQLELDFLDDAECFKEIFGTDDK